MKNSCSKEFLICVGVALSFLVPSLEPVSAEEGGDLLSDIRFITREYVTTDVVKDVSSTSPPTSPFHPQGIESFRSLLTKGAELSVGVELLVDPFVVPFWGASVGLRNSTSLGNLVNRTTSGASLYEQAISLLSSRVEGDLLLSAEDAVLNQAAISIMKSEVIGSVENYSRDSAIGGLTAIGIDSAYIEGDVTLKSKDSHLGGSSDFPSSLLSVESAFVGGDILHLMSGVSSSSHDLQVVTWIDNGEATIDHLKIGIGGNTKAFYLGSGGESLSVGQLTIVYLSQVTDDLPSENPARSEIVQWVTSDTEADLQLVELGATEYVAELTLYVDGEDALLEEVIGSITTASITLSGARDQNIADLIEAIAQE